MAAAASLGVVTGCSPDVRLSDTVTTYGYRQGDDGRWLLVPSRSETGDLSGAEETLTVAVGVLLGDEAASPDERTFWSGPCAPGTSVVKVDVGRDVVTVRLGGTPPAPDSCSLTGAEVAMQGQQVAWTVDKALDPLHAEAAPTPVVVVDAGGRTWPRTAADEAYLQPEWRPTPHTTRPT
jgi:hypothetical protein